MKKGYQKHNIPGISCLQNDDDDEGTLQVNKQLLN